MCSAFFFTKSPYQPRCLNHLGTNLKRKHPIPEFIYFQAASIHKGGEIEILIRLTKLSFFFSLSQITFQTRNAVDLGFFLKELLVRVCLHGAAMGRFPSTQTQLPSQQLHLCFLILSRSLPAEGRSPSRCFLMLTAEDRLITEFGK